MFLAGQGVFGRIRFTDGIYPEYDRAYLVVDVTVDKVGLINVSSVEGKEHKLLFPYNKEIKKHNPPFPRRSFAKLDSLLYISVSEMKDLRVLSGGIPLDSEELNSIIGRIINNTNKPP